MVSTHGSVVPLAMFLICRICVKYLTNIMSEVGLLHLSGAHLSWGPIVWGPTERGPSVRFLKVDSWAPKNGAKTTAVFLYFCILNPPPTKTATVFLYLQYNPDHSKTIQHIHWNPSQHLSSYIYMVCMTFRCYWYILAIFTLRGTLKYPNHLLPNAMFEVKIWEIILNQTNFRQNFNIKLNQFGNGTLIVKIPINL